MSIYHDHAKQEMTILTLTYLLSEYGLTVLQVLLELPLQHFAELPFCKSSKLYPCIQIVLLGALHGSGTAKSCGLT